MHKSECKGGNYRKHKSMVTFEESSGNVFKDLGFSGSELESITKKCHREIEMKKRAREIQYSQSLKKINSMEELKIAVKQGTQDRITSITINDGELWDDFEFLIDSLKECKLLVYLRLANIDGYEFKRVSGFHSKTLDVLFSAIGNCKYLETVSLGNSTTNEFKMLIEKSGRICEIE